MRTLDPANKYVVRLIRALDGTRSPAVVCTLSDFAERIQRAFGDDELDAFYVDVIADPGSNVDATLDDFFLGVPVFTARSFVKKFIQENNDA